MEMDKNFFLIISFLVLLDSIIFYYSQKLLLLFGIIIAEFLLIIMLKKGKPGNNQENRQYEKLLTIIQDANLKDFQDYIKLKNITPSQLTKMEFTSKVTPFLFAISKGSFDIFKYMIEFGVDLNYAPENRLKPIAMACYYAPKKFVKELLKYKSKINLYERTKNFNANCLEIAVWRARASIVRLLLENGMKFSIKEYNDSVCGANLINFDKVDINVKKELLRAKIFQMKKTQFNFHDKVVNKQINLKAFAIKPYIWENLLKYS